MPDRATAPGQPLNGGCPGFCFKRFKPLSLSRRERETLTLAAYGHTDLEIARRLCLGARTVRVYLFRARQKLNAANTTHAVAVAVSLKLIDFDACLASAPVFLQG